MERALKTPGFAGVDTRTNAEFMRELEQVREMPLIAKLSFLRNAKNRDRAICIPKSKLTRLLSM